MHRSVDIEPTDKTYYEMRGCVMGEKGDLGTRIAILRRLGTIIRGKGADYLTETAPFGSIRCSKDLSQSVNAPQKPRYACLVRMTYKWLTSAEIDVQGTVRAGIVGLASQ